MTADSKTKVILQSSRTLHLSCLHWVKSVHIFTEDICRSSTPESWYEFTRYNKERANAEVKAAVTLGEVIDDTLAMTKNELESQRTATEFAFRKRLHQQELAKGELEWQEFKVSLINLLTWIILNKWNHSYYNLFCKM